MSSYIRMVSEKDLGSDRSITKSGAQLTGWIFSKDRLCTIRKTSPYIDW